MPFTPKTGQNAVLRETWSNVCAEEELHASKEDFGEADRDLAWETEWFTRSVVSFVVSGGPIQSLSVPRTLLGRANHPLVAP